MADNDADLARELCQLMDSLTDLGARLFVAGYSELGDAICTGVFRVEARVISGPLVEAYRKANRDIIRG